ncbi:CMP/dCMP deaminase family protein [Phakopsora pachyrhizi]|nr:CMP/dCMP deaminase family protein [Phakopsora pachyrhizi]
MVLSTTKEPIHLNCMRKAIRLARLCKPIPTAFCVGCVITISGTDRIISSGYSRELGGNTHAEQCAIKKLLDEGEGEGEEEDKTKTEDYRFKYLDLYSTMEPCSVRLSGQVSCSEILIDFNKFNRSNFKILNIYLGVIEPDDFVRCDGISKLNESGINVTEVYGISEECLKIARGYF